MSVIRKHAALWALLSCLALAIAAPYLIPANPDSAVFRSGPLGLILEFACFYSHLSGSFARRQTPVCQRAGLRLSVCRRPEHRF